MVGLVFFILDIDGERDELAQAICDQEYNMDFDSYNDHELKCKEKTYTKERTYDGITVQIK